MSPRCPGAPERAHVAARLAARTGEVIPGAAATVSMGAWVVRVGLACVALAAELALLGRAHAAVSRGDFTGAESALASHARRYPRGSLVHEREALRVQCLAAGGDRAAAEAARQRFHRRFPESVLGATVDRAVAEMR